MNVRLGTARTIMVGPVLDADGVAKTNLAVAAILASKNGGNPAALDGSATLTHKQTGHYLLLLTANDISALGVLELSIDSTTDAMPIKALNVLTVTAWDALHAASGGYVPSDLVNIHGTALTETATQLAAAFTKFFDVASPTGTVNSLADAVPGAAGGGLIAGTNAATTITSAGGNALTLSSTGTNGAGLAIAGNGSGAGMAVTGGATGAGLKLLGGASGGAGLDARSQAGTGGANYAAYFLGNASGADTGGLYCAGGATGGEGLECIGSGNGHGFYAVGSGTGEGMHVTGGSGNTGNGAIFEAGSSATNGRGLICQGVGGGTSHGFYAKGGTTGDGMHLERGGASADDLAFATPSISNLGAIGLTTLTASGAVAFQSTFDVTGATTLTGAVSLGSTLGITGAVTLSSTLTTGAVTFASATVTGAMTTGSIVNNGVLTQTGNVTLAGTYTVDGVSTYTGAATYTGGIVANITGNLTGNVTGSIGSLAAQAKADVNAEVLDVMATDTFAEGGQGAPGATISLSAKIGYLYKNWRNKKTQTSTEFKLYADDTTTVDQKAAISDDTTTATKGEMGTGA